MAPAGTRAAVDADVAGGQRHRDGCTGWFDEDPHFGASSTKLKRERNSRGRATKAEKRERERERKGWRVQVGARWCTCACKQQRDGDEPSGGRARDGRGRRTTLTIARERMQHETVHGPGMHSRPVHTCGRGKRTHGATVHRCSRVVYTHGRKSWAARLRRRINYCHVACVPQRVVATALLVRAPGTTSYSGRAGI